MQLIAEKKICLQTEISESGLKVKKSEDVSGVEESIEILYGKDQIWIFYL